MPSFPEDDYDYAANLVAATSGKGIALMSTSCASS
jgi:hypothetical protein